MVKPIRCGMVNCYIVTDGGDSGILVDTGRRESLRAVMKACAPYKIRLIVLTHGHYDHTENAARLSDRFGAPIAMHADDVDLVASFGSQPMSASNALGRMILSVSLMESKRRKTSPFAPSVFLKDGDDLSRYGVPAKVIGLPGHTRGSIGLDVAGKELIAGDALLNMLFPSVSPLRHDETAALSSARKIAALGERTVYFGHGRPMRNRDWVK
jgi:glyoxylase-like metal-dependent hydrolase (beta-lactamase superfamily II)